MRSRNTISNKKGFTLVELIVVFIIVAILASVAIPIFKTMRARAMLSEAAQALSMIKTDLRVYYTEYRQYPTFSGFLVEGPSLMAALNIKLGTTSNNTDGDLDGTYFSEECYSLSSSPGSYQITCYVWNSNNRAPRKDETKTIESGGTGYITTASTAGAGFSTVNIPDSGYQ